MPNEPILEPIARLFRFRETSKLIKKQNIKIVDIGCGPNVPFYHFIKERGIKIKKYIAIDPLITVKKGETNEIMLVKSSLNKKINLKSNISDYTVAHAFLEHVDYPKEILLEMIRITKPKGKTIITTPTQLSKRILEFLAYRLNLISKREIKEHKNYFDKESLLNLLNNQRGISIKHKYFEFGLNNLLIIQKNK